MTKIDSISKESISRYNEICSGLKINNKAHLHSIAAAILADSQEVDLGV